MRMAPTDDSRLGLENLAWLLFGHVEFSKSVYIVNSLKVTLFFPVSFDV